MVALRAVRVALSDLSQPSDKPVAIFVGGTSGIGEAAVKSFAKWTKSAQVYIIGRNPESASKTIAACRTAAPSSSFEFVQQDIMVMKNVDRVCEEICSKESRVDLLYMTQDIPTFSGRVETEEGIDKLMSLRYYTRMRFIQRLLPLLRNATCPRVVSVLGPKIFESALNLDDLGLEKRYGTVSCFSHCSLMNTFCMEEFAIRNPSISFVHVYPGVVLTTNVLSGDLPWVVRKLIQWVLYPIFYYFAQSYEESGDRMMYISFSPSLSPKETEAGAPEGAWLPLESDTELMKGSDGLAGSGNYCIDWKCKRMVNDKKLEQWREKDARKLIWEHTQTIFDDIDARS